MSHLATAWAFDQTGISSTAKLVLIFLADFHNHQTNLCFPSRAKLAEKCCCDEKTITRAIQELSLAGLISYEVRKDLTGRQTSNTYTLHIAGGQFVQGEGDKLSPLEPVINNNTNPSDLHDPLIGIFANYSEEPPKVPEKAKTFWDEAVGMLMVLGLEDGYSRRMIGRWLKQTHNNQEEITRAINAALDQGTQDPVPYITQILGGKNGKKKEIEDAFAELRASGSGGDETIIGNAEGSPQDDTGEGGGTDHVVLQSGKRAKGRSVSQKRGGRTRKVSIARPPEVGRPIGGYLSKI
jgi:hypothetical protein